jgi:hypothetical protein
VPATARWARGATMPNQFSISRKTFERLEDWIKDNEASSEKAKQGMDTLVRLCVLVVKAEAQKRTMGPVAPRGRSNPALAYRVPVQRITGRYFAGWTVRRTRFGAWMIYNDERAAYFVEFGIGQRVRRPILKMSVIAMLKFLQSTRTGERFAEYILAPRRSPQGRFRSFDERLGSLVRGMGAGPVVGRSVTAKETE